MECLPARPATTTAPRNRLAREAWLTLLWPLAAAALYDHRLLPAAAFGGCVVVAACSRTAGVLLWVVAAGVWTLPLYRVRNANIPLCTAYLSVLVAWWAIDIVRRRGPQPYAGRLRAPLLVLAGVGVLSLVQGALFYDPVVPGAHRFLLAEVYATALVVLSVCAAWLVGSYVNTIDMLRRLQRSLVGLSVILVAGLVLPLPLPPRASWWPMVLMPGVTLLYTMLLCSPARAFWPRAAAAGLVIYTVVYVVALPFVLGQSQWISGWIMVTVPLGVVTLVVFPRTGVAALICGVPVGAYLTAPWLRQMVDLARAEGDFGRLLIWRDALRLMAVRPILGVGPGNYLDYAMAYAQTHVLLYGSAHGNYQQILAEMGLVGLATVLWLAWRTCRLGWQVYRSSADPHVRSVALAALATVVGALCACVIGDYLLPAYHNGGHTNICATIYVWVMIGALIAAEGVGAGGPS